jgi:hypothetical protein
MEKIAHPWRARAPSRATERASEQTKRAQKRETNTDETLPTATTKKRAFFFSFLFFSFLAF